MIHYFSINLFHQVDLVEISNAKTNPSKFNYLLILLDKKNKLTMNPCSTSLGSAPAVLVI